MIKTRVVGAFPVNMMFWVIMFFCSMTTVYAESLVEKEWPPIQLENAPMICPPLVYNALKKKRGRLLSHKRRVRQNIYILQNWLRSQGYMDARVTYVNHQQETYHIHAGPRWHISFLGIKPALSRIYPDIPKVGDPFTTEHYEKGKAALQRLWLEKGYLNARLLVAEVRPDRSNQTMQVRWEMEVGQYSRISAIEVQGHATYSGEDIISLSGLQIGEVATAKALRDATERISRDIRFRSASVFSRMDQLKDNMVPVLITVVETPRFELLGNLGYSSDLGFSVQSDFKDFGVLKGLFNTHLHTAISDVEKGAGVTFSRPTWPSSRDSTGVQGDFVKQDSAALRTQIWSAGVFVRREFSQYNYAKLSVNEKWIQSSDVNLKLFEPMFEFRLDWRNQQSGYLRDGWRVDGRFGLPIALQGQGKWAYGQVGSRFYMPLTRFFLLVPRVGYGMTFAINGTVPKQLRQYLGGAANVRGYKLGSVGFSGLDSLALGGRKAAYAGIDVVGFPERTVSPVVFADMGRVWDLNVREQPLAVAAGVGIIFNTDIGSVRVDVAMPLRRFGLNMGSRWYFSLGEVL